MWKTIRPDETVCLINSVSGVYPVIVQMGSATGTYGKKTIMEHIDMLRYLLAFVVFS